MAMVALARLVATHGTRGEIKARSFSGELDHILQLPAGEVRRSGIAVAVTIESARTNKDEVLVRFAGVESIEAARELVGGELWALPEYAAPRAPEEYYIRDLIGMSVIDADGEVGTVTAVFDGTQAPLLEVSRESGRVLVPFMNEYIGTIDEDRRTVEITKRWILDFE